MDLKSALRKVGLAKVEFGPGDVCIVKDGVIRFPDDEENRKYHPTRSVIILSNNFLSTTITYPLVTIAPTSHVLKWKNAAEIVVSPTDANGLTYESRIMLGHILPLIKTDIEKKIGELSFDDWENLMERVVKNFDRV